MSHRAKLAALTGALVALAAPRGARADSGDASAASASSPRVALVLDGDCAGEATATEKIFAIELDARVVPSAPDVTTARVRCEGANATVVVSDPVTGKSLERRVDLAAFAESKGRARAVAIAAAELVSASWAEAALPPPRVPPVAATPIPQVERATITTRASRATDTAPLESAASAAPHASASITALGAVRAFPDVLLVGGGVRYDAAAARRGPFVLGLSLDFGAAHGRASTALGSVDADTVDGAGAIIVRAALSRATWVRAGAGLRVGHASLSGHPGTAPATGASVRGFSTAPHAAVGLATNLTSALFVECGGELGAVVNGPRGTIVDRDRASTVALRGVYATGTAGAGARF